MKKIYVPLLFGFIACVCLISYQRAFDTRSAASSNSLHYEVISAPNVRAPLPNSVMRSTMPFVTPEPNALQTLNDILRTSGDPVVRVDALTTAAENAETLPQIAQFIIEEATAEDANQIMDGNLAPLVQPALGRMLERHVHHPIEEVRAVIRDIVGRTASSSFADQAVGAVNAASSPESRAAALGVVETLCSPQAESVLINACTEWEAPDLTVAVASALTRAAHGDSLGHVINLIATIAPSYAAEAKIMVQALVQQRHLLPDGDRTNLDRLAHTLGVSIDDQKPPP
jgi:hypothetical protein